ncbi:MAG: hypothetical protein HQL23_04310 [Candidatus Omnitrophica bacterium]|nr:hypothetical protein [Candidatus Omnitrophota bacterium]
MTAGAVLLLPTGCASDGRLTPGAKISVSAVPAKTLAPAKSSQDVHQTYIDFFEQVYKKMDENYYQPVSRDKFNAFIEKFNTKIYAKLKDEAKSDDYIRWRSAALLVDALKTSEDIFSGFFPPEPAKHYAQTALGQRIDLGIEGRVTDKGYETTQVEPRSDAYQNGLRIGDVLLQIDAAQVKTLKEKEIADRLTPLAGSKVKLEFAATAENTVKTITVVSREYFRQAVFQMNIPIAGIYGLQIKQFNRVTGDDVARFLAYFHQLGEIRGLVLDLRGNPGGPPLAARELAGFFLKTGEDFAYFHKKGQPPAMLDVPAIPAQFKFDGPLVILIDKDSGSATELFSGVMRYRGRAVLMGTNSAGQVMLKSMFSFDDGSMVLLITSRGHYPDGRPFPFGGLTPDRSIAQMEGADPVKQAAIYLIYLYKKTNGL